MENDIISKSDSIAPLVKRTFMFLEDGEFSKASEYSEKVLDIEPENVEAYLGKLMSDLRVRKFEDLKNQPNTFEDNKNYTKLIRFADEKLKLELQGFIEFINTRNEQTRIENTYLDAVKRLNTSKTESEFRTIANVFDGVISYKDSEQRKAECIEKAKIAKKELQEAKIRQKKKIIKFSTIGIITVIAMVICISLIGSANRESMRKQLIGKTFTGTYVYSGISTTKDTYTITFIDENYCNIEYVDTNSGYYTASGIENGEFVYENYNPGYYNEGKKNDVPYELTGIFEVKFNWESQSGLYHSVEPFVITTENGKMKMETENFNSKTPLTLNEE